MMVRVLALLFACFLSLPAQADWWEAGTEHFVVYADRSPELLKRYAGRLERFDRTVRWLLNVPERPVGPANRVSVFVVGTQARVQRLAGMESVAGFYHPEAGNSWAVVPRLDQGASDPMFVDMQAVLFHEYTHHLMWTLAPHAVFPIWYREGVAEVLGTVSFAADGAILLGEPPRMRMFSIGEGSPIPMRKLLVAETLKPGAIRGDLYGYGWLLSHYLIFSGQRVGQLGSYLDALNRGKGPAESATVFGDPEALDRELERYSRGRLPVKRISGEVTGDRPVTLRRLSAGESATLAIRVRLRNGGDLATRRDTLRDARDAAGRFPGDAAAQLVLAEAALDADDPETAEAAADRAIAADPRAARAPVLKARAAMARAAAAKDARPTTWSAIRALAIRASRIDPEDPVPLMLFFDSYVRQGITPTDAAKDALAAAFAKAPQDQSLRLQAAAMYLHDGDAARARTLLMPLANQPHGRGRAKLAREVLERLDAGDAAGAAARFDAPEPKGDAD
jgi:tetratricopeptide (TPR) repeat protein